MALGTEVGLGPGHVVLDADPALPPQKKGGRALPIFCPFYCDQMAGCVKMPHSMEVGFGLTRRVRWGKGVVFFKKRQKWTLFFQLLRVQAAITQK